ncbi:MAG: homogentisate 1,2-dioxygenase [Deltaproteobacteria bacterium]|nr:homogentisate 1,2-dioxygenase [Deltaproteobacteria bacterium]
MSRRFSTTRGPTRVVLGTGTLDELGPELDHLGARRVALVGTPGRRDALADLARSLGARVVAELPIAREHVPMERVVEARAQIERAGADVLVAYGGGSAIGLGKAVAVAGTAKLVAIPTTYSGSEMTPVYGITEAGHKRTARDERVRPALVLYDARTTYGLSRDVTVTSLFNAMAHCVEALWAKSPEPAALAAAEEGLRLAASSLRRLVTRLDDAAAREDAMVAAYLAGCAFGDLGGAIHHKLCHVLGGRFGLPHAATHTVLLPHVVRFHREHAPDAMRRIARALGAGDPVDGFFALARDVGAPRSLAALGLRVDDIPAVVDEALASAAYNPRPLDAASLSALLRDAALDPPLRPRDHGKEPMRIPEGPLQHKQGFRAAMESEALPGALPRTQTVPRQAPYGLYPELLNGTPFTVRRDENTRSWLYRIRPSSTHSAYVPLPESRWCARGHVLSPNRMRWRPLPIPDSSGRVDWLDGMATLGGMGDPASGPGYSIHLYAANASMNGRSFANHDGELLVVPQHGALDCQTEFGWLRVAPGEACIIPRGIRFAVGVPEGGARGYVCEVFGTAFRLPERGPLGSNGLADARHFLSPVAAFEDREETHSLVTKLGGRLHAATQAHSPFDVVAWHGNHVPSKYDLDLFVPMGAVRVDHPDPSIHTVLTAPLDDHGRAVADFVVFPPRWEVAEHSLRPPPFHRNAATEVNAVIRTPAVYSGYEPGCVFLTPIMTSHGISTSSYDAVLDLTDEQADKPHRIPDGSLWVMFESALPFYVTEWALGSDTLDADFEKLFLGVRSRFDPGERLR